MGYGIVLHLRDRSVRDERISPDELGTDLARVLVDATSGPAGGPSVSAGPWQAAGAQHSSAMTIFTATAEGITITGTAPDDDDGSWAWQDQLTPRMHADAVRDVQRHPARAARLAAQSPDPFAAYFGADRSASAEASVWWFYADALGRADPATLGPAVVELMGSYLRASTSLGSHANALNKAGAIVAPGNVTLVWSGNRLCRPGQLTELEQPRWARSR